MPAFTAHIPVRFGDIDHARIAYYPNFYHYCHQAFEELWPARLGVHYQQVLDVDKVGFPAVHQEADFLSPVRYGETLAISISCEKIGTKSVTLRYRLDDAASGQQRAVLLMVLAVVDMGQLVSIPLPARHRAVFEGLVIS